MMKINLSNRLALGTVALLLFLPGIAVGQTSQTPAPQQPAPPAASSPMAGHPVPGRNAEERVEHRINELHAQLRITPAEQQQWDQFANVMRNNAREMDRIFTQRAQQLGAMNAVQNMESYEQLAEAHAQHVQKLAAAFRGLYDAMPEQQKQLADQVFHANAEQNAQRSHRGRNG
jgi:protein CpxP